ncbi:neprilysin-2-like [Drosophila rhopaloa]|uniref:Membrane metallo-endopeptidase-like 1 n=1 Tax=Drosophila rhopaloa TaxID=1041015 RepID=A0ABM5JBU2_DRORH|nr:neprilysin-2-like [Drosophila rhopaloa]
MNLSADPCEDFQNFATGQFVKKHEQDDCYSTQCAINHRFHGKLRNLFDQLKDRVFIDEISVEEKVWRYYNTCLTAPQSTRSARHYLELVSPGGNLTWPSFVPQGSQWPKQEFQWLESLAILRRYGLVDPLIRLIIKPSLTDSNKFRLGLFVPLTEQLIDVSEVKDLLTSIGVSSIRAGPLARSIIQLDSDAHNLTKLGDDLVYEYTLEDVQNRTNLQVDKYLQIVFGRSFDPSFEVEVDNIEYLEGINGVVSKYDSEVVASYLMIRFLRFVLSLEGSGSESDPAKCAVAVASQMELASDLLYENHYLGHGKLQKYTKEAQRIFEAVSHTFMTRLEENHLHLADNETDALQRKLLAMTVTVGKVPNNVNHRRFVANFYEDLELETDPDFARAQLEVLKHRSRRVLEQLNGPVPKGSGYFLLTDELPGDDPTPDFDLSGNTIVLPYAMLQYPYFVPESHDVFKMSLYGYLLTGEMMKFFMPTNIMYDSQGNFVEGQDIFDENEKYIDDIDCLNKTHSNDLDKRAIDVESLRLIYDAYFGPHSEFENQTEFTKTPIKKLFLLGIAHHFVGRDEDLDYGKVDSDTLRLEQAVKNLPAFGEIFNCSTSTRLNPEEKCHLW